MASFKFHERNYWESSKLTNSKITPSRESHAHFISWKPPHKNQPREYFETTLCFIQIATSVVEKSQIPATLVRVLTPSVSPNQKSFKVVLVCCSCDPSPHPSISGSFSGSFASVCSCPSGVPVIPTIFGSFWECFVLICLHHQFSSSCHSPCTLLFSSHTNCVDSQTCMNSFRLEWTYFYQTSMNCRRDCLLGI